MLNVTPQAWIAEREELGKEASSARVGLNVTEIESEQDRGELGKETSNARRLERDRGQRASKTQKIAAGT